MIACPQPFSLVTTSVCDASTDWFNNPGKCRLRIQAFNAALFSGAGCGACANAGPNTWDGTFPTYTPNSPGPGSLFYGIDPTTVSLFGKVPAIGNNCAVGFLAGSGWYLALACNPSYIWVGNFSFTGPLRTYAGPGIGCSPGPASVVIEAYSLP